MLTQKRFKFAPNSPLVYLLTTGLFFLVCALGNVRAAEKLGFLTADGEYKIVADGAEKKILEGKIKVSGSPSEFGGDPIVIKCGRVEFSKSTGDVTCGNVSSAEAQLSKQIPGDKTSTITVRKNGAIRMDGPWTLSLSQVGK